MSLQIFFLPSPHPNPFTNYYQPKKNKLLKSLDIAKKKEGMRMIVPDRMVAVCKVTV